MKERRKKSPPKGSKRWVESNGDIHLVHEAEHDAAFTVCRKTIRGRVFWSPPAKVRGRCRDCMKVREFCPTKDPQSNTRSAIRTVHVVAPRHIKRD